MEKEKRIARIFRTYYGDNLYHFCNANLYYPDPTKNSFSTKIAAQRAAKKAGYTHGVGNGMYQSGINKLSKREEEK